MPIVFTPEASAGGHGKPTHVLGDIQGVFGSLAFSGAYPAGGEAPTIGGNLPAASIRDLFKLTGSGVSIASMRVVIPTNNGYLYQWNGINEKVQVFQGDNANAAAAPFIELPAAAYPAAITNAVTGGATLIAVGY